MNIWQLKSEMMSMRITFTFLFLYFIIRSAEPAVVLSANKISPTITATAKLQCNVTGEAFVGWYDPKGSLIGKNGRKYVESSGTVHTLVLGDVRAADGGNYVCNGSLNTAILEVEVPFYVNPPRNQKLLLNNNGTIFLGASGYPTPSYKWKKDGLVLDQSDRNSGGRLNLLSDGSLEIPTVRVSDEGKYECHIIQGYKSKTIVIQITVVDRPRISGYPRQVRNVTSGYNTTFRCNATGIPTPSIKWLNRNGRIVDQVDDKRFTISSTNYFTNGSLLNTTIGLLTITNLKPEDKGTGFACQASSLEGQVKSGVARIANVYVLPTLNKTNDVRTKYGAKVVLTCTATGGDPKPVVQWTRNGAVVAGQQKNGTQSVIVFDKVKLQDMGIYSCKATNGARDENNNIIVLRQNVSLEVQSSPILNTKKSGSELLSFVWSPKPVKVVCEFDGNPTPNVTITWNGTTLASGQKTAVYEIKPVTKESFGSYFCSAINKNGMSNHSVEVKEGVVPSKPQDFRVLYKFCIRLTLVWRKPLNDGGFPVTQYFVEVRHNRTNEEVITKTVRAVHSDYQYSTIQNLERDTTYVMFIRARNEVGRGAIAQISMTTKQNCKPHRPTITSPIHKTLHTLYVILKWKKPENDGGDSNIRYRLVYKEMNDNTFPRTITDLNVTQYRVDGLKPGNRYRFQVFAVNSGGESDPAQGIYYVSPNVSGKGHAHAFSASIVLPIICALVAIMRTQRVV